VTTLIDMEKHKDILSVMQATVASLNRDNEELKHTLMRLCAMADGLIITPVTACERFLLSTINDMARIAGSALNDYH
jgi:translation elongation factor EF-Tu-like GTPase